MNRQGIECNLSIGDKFVSIEAKPGAEPRVRQTEILDANEHAALHAIVEVVRCLSTGKYVDHHFNPTLRESDSGVIVKCKWQKSGNLTLLARDVKKRFQHARNRDEAMRRHRVFTCDMNTYRLLPSRRTS